eukprot:TRINITY_DN7714_c0_g1_i2.p1 TRINITY_DN7714_c0_g1~~TRINITY_DN7714_c0_g1_i2.p1  ORF type:complete len:417 (-),score=63.34 TRINITY_DN7714_c0_g1_i2:528-1778(-)
MYISNARILSRHTRSDIEELVTQYEETNGRETLLSLEAASAERPTDLYVYKYFQNKAGRSPDHGKGEFLNRKDGICAQDIVDALKQEGDIPGIEASESAILEFKQRALVDLIKTQQKRKNSVLVIDAWNTIHENASIGKPLSLLGQKERRWIRGSLVGIGCKLAAVSARFSVSVYDKGVFDDGELTTCVAPYKTDMFTDLEDRLVLKGIYPQLWRMMGFEPVVLENASSDAHTLASVAAANRKAEVRLAEFRDTFGLVGRQIRLAAEQCAGTDWQQFMRAATRSAVEHWMERISAVCHELTTNRRVLDESLRAEPIAPALAQALMAVVDGGSVKDARLFARLEELGAFTSEQRPISQTVALACRRLVGRQIHPLVALFWKMATTAALTRYCACLSLISLMVEMMSSFRCIQNPANL